MRRNLLLAAGVLFGSSLTFAGDKSKEIYPEQGRGIAWQDYTQATATAKKAHKPVLVDFWRPG
ncbi:MAG: hypothetical protein L0196_07900 [candidate division Zixibacteria bacterium]|nr:hypothetical protein [candidate division Zixibacteria bacterium]